MIKGKTKKQKERFLFEKKNQEVIDIILTKLKYKVEGKCQKVGYIIPNSIKIQTRSLGMINNASFDGMTTYKVIYTCDVCNVFVANSKKALSSHKRSKECKSKMHTNCISTEPINISIPPIQPKASTKHK